MPAIFIIQVGYFLKRVTKILEKRAAHAVVLDVDRGLYEVVVKNERTGRTGRRDRRYKVILAEDSRPKCKYRKPQNTGITCKHVIAACTARNFDPNQFTHQYYHVTALMRTWEGTFEIFGREEDWPEFNEDRIIPDRTLVKKGRRKSKRLPMMMDVLEGRMSPPYCLNCETLNHTTDRCNRNMQTCS
jgi:hypothetical protein